MLTHIQVNNVIEAKRLELGLRKTQTMDISRKLKAAVVEELTKGFAPCEREFLGLGGSRLYDADWVNIMACAVVGRVLPVEIVEKIEAGKVRVLGQRSMPDGWGRLKFPVVPEPVENDPDMVYVGDPEGFEDKGLTWLCAHEAAETLVKESKMGSSQVLAVLLLLGFEPNEAKTVWVLNGGWGDDWVLKITKSFASLNSKEFKRRIFLAGAIDGDPKTSTPPWSAVFWCLVYALSGGSDQKKAARLRHLQQAFVEDTQGPVVKGLILFRNQETLGRLAVYRGHSGAIQVCNAEAVPTEMGATLGLKPAIEACEAENLVWTAQHQGGDLYVGAGAQACGLAADSNDPDWNVTFQSVDKDPKFLQRTATLMIKAATQTEIVELPGFGQYC